MHRKVESRRYASMLHYACTPCAEHHKKRVPGGLLSASADPLAKDPATYFGCGEASFNTLISLLYFTRIS